MPPVTGLMLQLPVPFMRQQRLQLQNGIFRETRMITLPTVVSAQTSHGSSMPLAQRELLLTLLFPEALPVLQQVRDGTMEAVLIIGKRTLLLRDIIT